jgi:hypothetical protein
VLTSSALILSPEFAESRFRKAYDEMTAERMDDASLTAFDGMAEAEDIKEDDGDSPLVRSEAITSESAALEMRFDRDGTFLKTIINAMRGYDVSDLIATMTNYHKRVFFADLEYYRLSSISDKYRDEQAGDHVDLRLMNIKTTKYNAATKTVEHVGPSLSTTWVSFALTGVLMRGTRTVEFKVVKQMKGRLMFGVMPRKAFSADFDLTGIAGGHVPRSQTVAWSAYPPGHLHTKAKKYLSAMELDDGNRIAVTAQIERKSTGTRGAIMFEKNGKDFEFARLQDAMDLSEGIVFVVSMGDRGTVVQVK